MLVIPDDTKELRVKKPGPLFMFSGEGGGLYIDKDTGEITSAESKDR